MKFNKILIALGVAGALIGAAQAAPTPANTVVKKITLTAQIHDAIFVSKPDGSTWYGTEELEADDYKQRKFSKTLPIRVWTKGTEFNISLAQPLMMSNGHKQMKNASVKLTHAGGEGDVVVGTALKVAQTQLGGDGGTDEIHHLKISVDAPDAAAGTDNGSYSGDLVMLFEPVAAVPTP
ncbi:CS1 type fimbrial major subunit [Pusillimonas sp. SM2304]|uniref:CS1 type fimbrial major subunit n=1 Tax=Pusillimonas sp. SM2304 TaxID=3073241 RepID=UPI002875CCF6|nr:CS1 type fimbrial major subunit [Pusillimonas sp. SM2304]MDS1138919.1 CS1 type fimbrial major subunit [Pusillimonas sp. SM2304]